MNILSGQGLIFFVQRTAGEKESFFARIVFVTIDGVLPRDCDRSIFRRCTGSVVKKGVGGSEDGRKDMV